MLGWDVMSARQRRHPVNRHSGWLRRYGSCTVRRSRARVVHRSGTLLLGAEPPRAVCDRLPFLIGAQAGQPVQRLRR